jgi:hypothetical protein
MRDNNYKALAPLERLVVTTLVPVVPPCESLAALRIQEAMK